MKLQRVVIHRVEIPLVRPFRTSFGTDTVRDALVIRVEGDDGDVGWGECVAGDLPLYSSEYVEAAWMTIERVLLPILFGRGELVAEEVAGLLGPVRGHRMAKAALEMAILDAELRSAGRSFASLLGANRQRVDVGVSVGITETVGELLEVVAAHAEEGYRRVKLKIEPGFDAEPARAVRRLLGADFMLQVDANAAYRAETVDGLLALDDLGLLLVEQPLDEEDLVGHVQLAGRMQTAICLDESLTSLETTKQALTLGACSVVNLKPGRVGGYIEARRIHDHCRNSSVPLWCGGMLETGIGRAANLALAAMPGFTLPGDISATARYFAEDITPPFVLEEGTLQVPDGPGFGVEVDEKILARLSVAEASVTADNL